MQVRTQAIRYIDLHHTAGHEADTAAIRAEHMASPNNWGDIGYNSVIEPNGVVGVGRDIKWAGAHDPGTIPGEAYSMNQISYAISHIGNFMVDEMSEIQFQASITECVRVCRLYNIPPTKERVRRHKDQYATDCPGDKFPYDRYITELKKRMSGGNEVKKVVVYFTPGDYSVALAVSNKLGGVAMFCRNGAVVVHPDAMAAGQVFTVGGPKLGHPNEVYMSGSGALETMGEVTIAYKGGKF